LKIQVNKKDIHLDLEQIIRIHWKPGPSPEEETQDKALSIVELTDKSVIHFKSIRINANEASLVLPDDSELSIPRAALAAITLNHLTEKNLNEIRQRSEKQQVSDILFIIKEDYIQGLEGAVNGSDGTKISFQWDGDNLEVPWRKVGAVLFYHPENLSRPIPLGRLADRWGGRWVLSSLELVDEKIEFQTRCGLKHQVSLKDIEELDLSIGKMVFLSQLDPLTVEETPYFDKVWHYRRNKNLHGKPLQLDGVSYSRGLYLHSRCKLSYLLDEKFSSFQAMAGIDDSTREFGHVVLKISGDDKVLFDSEIDGSKPARDLNLDVKGIRLLTIFVDFGKNLDIGDRLILAEARLLKSQQ